jgi:hypothetical protein
VATLTKLPEGRDKFFGKGIVEPIVDVKTTGDHGNLTRVEKGLNVTTIADNDIPNAL